MKKEITVKEWNEVKGLLLEIREAVTGLVDEKRKDLLTPDQVCEKLKICRRTYQRYVKKGIIEQIKQGDSSNSPALVDRFQIEKLLNV